MYRIILILIPFAPILAFGQLDTLRKTPLAQIDSVDVEVMRINKCEKVGSHYPGDVNSANYKYSSNYFVCHNGDSIAFHLWRGNGCPSPTDPPSDYKESVNLDLRDLDKQGQSELIMEFEYSGDYTYIGYHREIIIINLDSMEIIFRMEIEAYGQHFFGEELGDNYLFKYEMTFTDEGEIIIKRPNADKSAFIEEKYSIMEGVFVLIKE